jgi:hypothetical protein
MRFACVLAILLVSSGCQFDPHAHLYTTARPRPSDVKGTYTLTEQTVTPDGLSALGNKPCFIELREDGTFLARNVPPTTTDGETPDFFSRLVSAEGRWHIDSVGSISMGSGPSKTRWGIRLDSQSSDIRPVGLTGDKPPYGLIFTIGDPDSGDAFLLLKTR